MNGRELAEFIVDEASQAVPPDQVADVLLRLSWSMNCGDELLEATDGWLEGHDHRRIEIRLSMATEILPFVDGNRMRTALLRIGQIHPELSNRCRLLIDSRDRQLNVSK